MTTPATAMIGGEAFSVRRLERSDWPAVEGLFGSNGACGGCWCMFWRVARHGAHWEALKGASNRDSLKSLIEHGAVDAVLAWDSQGKPSGWCCFGRRDDFPRLLASRTLQREAPADRWAITCFFIPKDRRHMGLGTALLRAATAEAITQGAALIEGYPKKTGGKALPAPFVWTGVEAMFAEAGYQHVERATGMPPIFVYAASAGKPIIPGAPPR